MLGLSINHSTFVCTRYNEPLMTSVAGNLKVHWFATETPLQYTPKAEVSHDASADS